MHLFWPPGPRLNSKQACVNALVRACAQVTFDAAEDIQWVAREYLPVLERIAPYLPDMDFVVNTLDTPRVRQGAGFWFRVLEGCLCLELQVACDVLGVQSKMACAAPCI